MPPRSVTTNAQEAWEEHTNPDVFGSQSVEHQAVVGLDDDRLDLRVFLVLPDLPVLHFLLDLLDPFLDGLDQHGLLILLDLLDFH